MTRPWLKQYEPGVPHTLEIPEMTLSDMFDEAVKTSPEQAAMSLFGRRIRYGEFGRQVEQLAIALHRLGVKDGDRVAIMLPNIPQYPIAHFAILKIGAIVVPTNPMYVERELKHQLHDSGAETILTLDFLFPRVAKVRSETRLKNIIVTSISEYLPLFPRLLYPLKARKEGRRVHVKRAPGIHFYRDLLAEDFRAALPEIQTKPDDIALLLYTGGTTGLSKGAILTHRNLLANVLQIRAWHTEIQTEPEIVLCALPFFHSYGLTTCLHMAVLLKSMMALVPNPRDIPTLLKTIQKERASLFSGVPTLFVAINNYPDLHRYDLSSIKTCVSGGAPLPLEVARQFETVSRGNLVEGYGLSESSPVTHANPVHGKRKEGSIGLPVPNTDARVVDPETRKTLPVGEVGELAVRGPQVMRGYWNMEQETRDVLKDGWLFTGDIARMDEEGYFYIVDRKKDMIIAGGFNIFPREVEEVLYEHPGVLEAAVIGAPDEYRGETVKAFIVPKEGASLDPEEIVAFCRKRLAPFKVPRQIEFRESLPKSSIGKILRRVLKEEETQGTGPTS